MNDWLNLTNEVISSYYVHKITIFILEIKKVDMKIYLTECIKDKNTCCMDVDKCILYIVSDPKVHELNVNFTLCFQF